ncbi:TRM11 family methyltransferase [Sporosarcina sp. HYO08]|uniref:TRM11 family SAM-dependent methyltransferase n=1 Tax=Sporosarcina sp. HYO08 TaxID=1759557 RepID=UPI0007960A17|nr:RsmD family RNA methyltransferase [Sporosarcina sp. HYO08]KXH87039.1 RNA methyltransferase [Sporosarcina sp. HYO08]
MNELGFLYTYVRHVDEQDLCRLEMRAFFGEDTLGNVIKSTVRVDADRSPFMKERLEIIFEDAEFEGLLRQVSNFQVEGETFRVMSMNTTDLDGEKKFPHADRRKIEREIGLCIQGEPDLTAPAVLLGVVKWNGKWFFGKYEESKAIWFHHQKKPHSYSTALSTRVARAVANIAVPFPEGIRAIDPCCGIGTVLVEALSMGIDMMGRDINPLVVKGSRKNIAHFGYEGTVVKGPIADVRETYDVVVIDMPYNLFTHITPEGQLGIIQDARRIAKKAVIVTVDTIDNMVSEAGFSIADRCVAKKGTFERQVLVCE